MGRTEGKVVVVTGAAGGQCAAEARALAAEGARVIAIDGGQSAHGGAKSLSDAVLREAATQTREE